MNKENNLSNFKCNVDDFDIEIDVSIIDENNDIDDIDKRLGEITNILEDYNKETKPDKIDYCVAASTGLLVGVVDTIFAGDLFYTNSFEIGDKVASNITLKFAKHYGYKGNDLSSAIMFMENKYTMASDTLTDKFGGGPQHHLRDFSHHCSIIGLFFSLLTQFTGRSYGTDRYGKFINPKIGEDAKWLIGNNFHEKIAYGTINWFMHLVSDMAGSSSTRLRGGIGTGIPGPILSLAKFMSSLPIFNGLDNNKKTSVAISKLFKGTLFGKNSDKTHIAPFDLRTEIGLVAKQNLIISLNEVIVRTFYFIRRLYFEIKDKDIRSIKEFNKIEYKNVLPFKSRVLTRMLTVSLAVLETVDVTEALVESAVKSKGQFAIIIPHMITKVNFVGIGRLALSVGKEIRYGIDDNIKKEERIKLLNEYIFLSNAKLFYKQKEMWKSAYNCGVMFVELSDVSNASILHLMKITKDNEESIKRITDNIDEAEEKNPGIKDSIKDIMGW